MEQLDAGNALVVGAHRADDLGGELPQGVLAMEFGDRAHPCQRQLLHRRGLCGGHLALEVDEAPRHRHLLGERLHLDSEQGGQLTRHGERVADPGGIRIDRRPLHRCRQRFSRAVQDVAAHSHHGTLLQAMDPGPRQDLFVVTELQVEGPGDERGGHRQHRQNENRPPAAGAVAARPRGAHAPRGVRSVMGDPVHGAGGVAGSR